MMYKWLVSLVLLTMTANAFAAVTIVEGTHQASIFDGDGDNVFEFVDEFESNITVQARSTGQTIKTVVNFDLSQFGDNSVEYATIDFVVNDYQHDDIRVDLVAFNGPESITIDHGSHPAELLASYVPRELDRLPTYRAALALDASVLNELVGNNLSLRFEVGQGLGSSVVFPITSEYAPKLNLVLKDRVPDQPEIPAPTPSVVLEEGFEAYGANENPDNWFDSRWGNSLAEQDNFQTTVTDGNKVFSTSSTYTNIHSHYTGSALDGIEGGYEFQGRLKFSDSQAGIGVTFFSQYPNADHYYRLRRYGSKPYFHLSSHGTSVQGDTASAVAPNANEWVNFKILVEDTGTQTTIKARLWPEGSEEPNEWQIDAYDSSSNRLSSGTIGVWSMRAGQKFWDDFSVTQLSPPAPTVETPNLRYLTVAEATSLANSNNLLIGQINYVLDIAVPGRVVLDQTPNADASVPEGSVIDLTVSDNEYEAFPMPHLIGLQQSYVESFLAASWINNLDVRYTHDWFYPAGMVTFQDPEMGESVWSEYFGVTLVVSLGPEPQYTYEDQFLGAAGSDPVNWFDTKSSNRMSEDDSLFKLFDLDTGTALGTASTDTNIHSHYVGSALDGLNDLEFTGKMRVSDTNSGIGVTVFSQYPNADKYYRLRRWERGGSFHLSPHGTSLSGTTDSGVTPAPDQWYQFRIRATDTGTETQIKAKIWLSGEAEPTSWQIDAYDSSSSRQTTGTIGVWSMGPGSKFWDDFAIDTHY